MAIIWSGLFDRFAALEVAALMGALLDKPKPQHIGRLCPPPWSIYVP
jgi:hypothetical protein